jgi:hypothetical protein
MNHTHKSNQTPNNESNILERFMATIYILLTWLLADKALCGGSVLA